MNYVTNFFGNVSADMLLHISVCICYLPKENGETTEIDVLMIHQSGAFDHCFFGTLHPEKIRFKKF